MSPRPPHRPSKRPSHVDRVREMRRGAAPSALPGQPDRLVKPPAAPPPSGAETTAASTATAAEGVTVGTVLLRPRDPIIVRDARPFAADPGARAFSLPWPLPRTTAGAIRTHVGNAAATPFDWDGADAQGPRAALKIAVHGPLLVRRARAGAPWEVCVPAPRDVVFYRRDDAAKTLDALRLRPQPPAAIPAGAGCDLPDLTDARLGNGLRRAGEHVALQPLRVPEEVKPESRVPAYWSLADAMAWLRTPGGQEDAWSPPVEAAAVRGQAGPTREARVHVGIDPATQTGRDGALFSTEALAFRDAPRPIGPTWDGAGPGGNHPADAATAILCRVSSADSPWSPDPAFIPLGGERRLAELAVDDPDARWPSADDWLPTGVDLSQIERLRLQLVTPAIFAHGWLPGWVADTSPPGLGGFKLGMTLVGAAIERRVPVSGWRMAHRDAANGRIASPPAPRATDYAVPAGGVYFFAIARGSLTADVWRTLWLAPISDLPGHRNEGFGLVLPGIW